MEHLNQIKNLQEPKLLQFLTLYLEETLSQLPLQM